MNLLSESATKAFSLLSIGPRGVGKTVFLAGSYAELHSDRQTNHPHQLWFDCQDSLEQENIDNILSFVAQSGQYPPPTMKITSFNFSLKRRSLRGVQTLCHFRWWDIPGESCNIYNPDFQTMVLTSHGCCVFINADALLHDKAYLQALEDIVKQVVAIASLVNQHRLEYAFALILTKCDLLEPGPITLLQIEENLQPLITGLNAVRANYQRFYSAIPIVSCKGASTLKATGAAASLLWLVSELRKLHNFQSRQDLGSGLKRSLSKSVGKASPVKNVLGLNLPSTARKYIFLLTLSSVSILGVTASLLFALGLFRPDPEQAQAPTKQIREYERVLQRDPNNFDALINLANLRIQFGQPDQAVPLMEKLVYNEPERLDLRLNLVDLYKLTGQKHKAETAYDQILAQHKNNLSALIGKAMLRNEQGDTETAKALFAQAEKAAPSELKAKIRAIAQINLPATAESMPSTK